MLSLNVPALHTLTRELYESLSGVGWAQANKLQLMGVELCSDLQKIALQQLQKEFGPKTGQSLYNYCRGIDDRQMKMEQERKSVSAEINYGIRFTEVGKRMNE